MACRSCKRPLNLFLRPSATPLLHDAVTVTFGLSSLSTPLPTIRTQRRRLLHATPTQKADEGSGSRLQRWLLRPVADRLQTAARKTTHSYIVYGTTQKIYKACSAQADYRITDEDRRAGRVQIGDDGEEIGVGGGMWHEEFALLPSFSTWSQVTMLHLYLLVVRLRCLDGDSYQTWQAQLVDHFFHESEAKMEHAHGITSGAIRQRYLKDLFVQWRGVLLAYDEGLVRGDAVLAAAVWRNLFRADDGVDLRALAAIVSWMRLSLRNLDQMPDDAILHSAVSAFKWPAKAELAFVDHPAKALEGVYLGEKTKPQTGPQESGT